MAPCLATLIRLLVSFDAAEERYHDASTGRQSRRPCTRWRSPPANRQHIPCASHGGPASAPSNRWRRTPACAIPVPDTHCTHRTHAGALQGPRQSQTMNSRPMLPRCCRFPHRPSRWKRTPRIVFSHSNLRPMIGPPHHGGNRRDLSRQAAPNASPSADRPAPKQGPRRGE